MPRTSRGRRAQELAQGAAAIRPSSGRQGAEQKRRDQNKNRGNERGQNTSRATRSDAKTQHGTAAEEGSGEGRSNLQVRAAAHAAHPSTACAQACARCPTSRGSRGGRAATVAAKAMAVGSMAWSRGGPVHPLHPPVPPGGGKGGSPPSKMLSQSGGGSWASSSHAGGGGGAIRSGSSSSPGAAMKRRHASVQVTRQHPFAVQPLDSAGRRLCAPVPSPRPTSQRRAATLRLGDGRGRLHTGCANDAVEGLQVTASELGGASGPGAYVQRPCRVTWVRRACCCPWFHWSRSDCHARAAAGFIKACSSTRSRAVS
jgi:hypothetical protein